MTDPVEGAPRIKPAESHREQRGRENQSGECNGPQVAVARPSRFSRFRARWVHTCANVTTRARLLTTRHPHQGHSSARHSREQSASSFDLSVYPSRTSAEHEARRRAAVQRYECYSRPTDLPAAHHRRVRAIITK